MDINFSKEDIAFRDEVRDWLANDYPKHVKEKTDAGITTVSYTHLTLPTNLCV